MFSNMGKILIGIGIIFIVIGVIVYFGGKLGLGKLPGDISYKKGNFMVYFPIASSILLSIILTIILNLIRFKR